MTIEPGKVREDYEERNEVEVRKEGNEGGWIEKTQENAKGEIVANTRVCIQWKDIRVRIGNGEGR